MGEELRMYDGITGALILPGILLGSFGSQYWLLFPGITCALMLKAPSVGFT